MKLHARYLRAYKQLCERKLEAGSTAYGAPPPPLTAAAPTPTTSSSKLIPMTKMPKMAPISPQIRPALVMPRPVGSIVPASISLRSLPPKMNATIPQTKQSTMPQIPSTRIIVPRWGFIPGVIVGICDIEKSSLYALARAKQ